MRRRRPIQVHVTGDVVWSQFVHDDSDLIGPIELRWTSIGLGADRWRHSVSLRTIAPAAYDDVERLVSSEAVRRFGGADYRPDELASAISAQGSDDKDWFFICVNELPIGFGSLCYLSELDDDGGPRRVASPCLFVVDERYRGQGVGRWALEGATLVGLETCDVVRVQVELDSPMAALCESVGFELIGLHDAGLVMERRAST